MRIHDATLVVLGLSLLGLAPTQAQEARVARWEKLMRQHERLVTKSLEIGDGEELQRQGLALRARSNESASWPDDDRWIAARIYCTTMAQELANFVDDKLKGTARGELAAEASLGAYRDAEPKCKSGILKLR